MVHDFGILEVQVTRYYVVFGLDDVEGHLELCTSCSRLKASQTRLTQSNTRCQATSRVGDVGVISSL